MRGSCCQRPFHCLLSVTASCLTWVATTLPVGYCAVPETDTPVFDLDVKPVLARHCFKCHGDGERKGRLDLRTMESIRRGGKRGTAIEPGTARASLVYQRLVGGEMPPRGQPRLTLAELGLVRRWLDGGAPARSVAAIDSGATDALEENSGGHYAFRKLVPPTLPTVRNKVRVRTVVDRFVQAERSISASLFTSVHSSAQGGAGPPRKA